MTRGIAILSGGQTGTDRAALDAARACGLPHFGICPRGRRAEDGLIDPIYPLIESAQARPIARTRANMAISDATLVLWPGYPKRRPHGGSSAIPRLAGVRRPLLRLDPGAPDAVRHARRFVLRHRIAYLNVAGPRESEMPGIYALILGFMTALCRTPPPISWRPKRR